MANIFDVANAAEGAPLYLHVGGFSQWKLSDLVSDYPTATHSAEYVARVSGSTAEIKIAATEAATYYLFTVTTASSATFTTGTYTWQLNVTETSSGNKAVVDSGMFTVVADADTDSADLRSHAEIMVSKIETLLSGKADSDVASYQIAGRSLTKLSFKELVDARDHYRREVVQMKNTANIKAGKSGASTIKVRF